MSREEFEQASTRVGHAEGRELGADGAGQLATARGPGGGAREVLVRGLIRGQAAPAGADQPHVETRLAAKQLEDRAVAFAARQVLEELTQPGELQANRSHLACGALEDALAVADREGARGSRLLHHSRGSACPSHRPLVSSSSPGSTYCAGCSRSEPWTPRSALSSWQVSTSRRRPSD